MQTTSWVVGVDISKSGLRQVYLRTFDHRTKGSISMCGHGVLLFIELVHLFSTLKIGISDFGLVFEKRRHFDKAGIRTIIQILRTKKKTKKAVVSISFFFVDQTE